MKAALYARVSTSDKGQDPEVQLREMRGDASRRGWEITNYVDEGISGAKAARPELDRLWRDVRAGKVDAVMVQRFDRFARSVEQLVAAMQEFNSRGVQFISVHEGVDTTVAQGRLVFHIFAAIAEFERELTRERVRSGLAAARAKGRVGGRPRVSVTRDKVTSLAAQGRSVSAIVAETGVSASTVRRLMGGAPKTYEKEAP